MPAPIRPSEICALVPSGTSSLCDRMLKVFLQLPRKFCDLASYLFNEDGTLTEAFIREVAVLPVGMIVPQATTVVPNGWLLCDGREVSRATYPQLFAALGTTYGNGDGSTSFNLPDYRGRFLLGKSSTRSIGDTGGEETHLLTGAESGTSAHTHTVSQIRWSATHGFDNSAGGGDGITDAFTPVTDPSVAADALVPHATMPPFAVVCWIIKY